MIQLESAFPTADDIEISALIKTLHDTGQRLHDLTAGEIDTVADQQGRTFLLHEAQVHMRNREAAKQAAILNALPAGIALIDSQGMIVSVNDSWRDFGNSNGLVSGAGVGVNYLAVCDRAHGKDSAESKRAAQGIRSVLAGEEKIVSVEYPCHSPTEQRWFRMIISPLAEDTSAGAVVMHLNITERKQADIRIQRLNRGYMVLSQINELIVRVESREELFQVACRIAVDAGQFPLAWIGVVDVAGQLVEPKASAGADGEFLERLGERLSLAADAPLGYGPAAVAVLEKRMVVVNDIATDPAIRNAGIHLDRGIGSLVSLPLFVAGEVVAVLSLEAADVDYFAEAELKLLQELAGDIAFAIDHIGKADKLNYLAYYDVLTGLANQTLFLERASQCLRSAASANKGAAMVLVDLERFKSINDSLGQLAGDELLKQVAAWLSETIEDHTLLARVGSDHFAMMISEGNNPDGALRKLDRVIESFHQHPFVLNGVVYRIAAKFGVAMFPEDGEDAESLFKKAESALKSAKASGRRHLFYTQKMTESVARKMSLENRLRQALDNEEFVLHYQPKVDSQSGKLAGVEALIRWNDPRTGLVPPVQFISILEETGMIYNVGRWAMRKALDDYMRWLRAGWPAVRVAVNVSQVQLRAPGFVAEIRQLLETDEQAAAGLELEITESMIMEDIDQSIVSLRAIRDMGVSIAIDDFGTGFSSLGYLAKLPIDKLKIDRSFVTDMTCSPEGLSLVSTIITLAHTLKLKVVAEGVETEQQSNLLKLLRCDEMQGYLFSKPLPCEIFEVNYYGASTC